MSKRTFVFALTMMVLLGLLGGSVSFAQQVADIQKAIQRSGANWVAGETSMTRLSPAERMKRVGLILPKVTGKEKLLAPETKATRPISTGGITGETTSPLSGTRAGARAAGPLQQRRPSSR